MQQLQCLNEHGAQRPRSRISRGILLVVESGLHHLDVPVAELLPDEIINLLYGDAQLILVHVGGNFLCQAVALGQDPLVRIGESCQIHRRHVGILHVHHNKPGRIPYLVGKITACLHTLPVETHVVARCISGN